MLGFRSITARADQAVALIGELIAIVREVACQMLYIVADRNMPLIFEVAHEPADTAHIIGAAQYARRIARATASVLCETPNDPVVDV